jgi:DeoR/GlpR family transcriptional regulator of sugar metabolism
MLAEERRKKIRNRLSRQGQVSMAELVKELGVSEDTIRRDLKELAEVGLLRKVHGGAVATNTVPYEYSARQELNIAAKSAIAKRAVSLIRDDMLIYADGGTTTAQLANHLPSDLRATFVTNSVATASALSALPNCEIILLGGKLIPGLLLSSGPQLIEEARRFRPTLSVISVHGITPEAGATVDNYDDSLIKKAFIQTSAEVAILAGQEKLGFIASFTIAELKDLSYLISDADAERLKPFQQAGLTTWAV